MMFGEVFSGDKKCQYGDSIKRFRDIRENKVVPVLNKVQGQLHLLRQPKRKKSYNYHNSGHYPSSCLLFQTQLNSVGLSVPHRKHVTSPLRAQQVNAVYRLVTTVY
jgi:hypothetical protein